MELIVNSNANALLAFADAERAAKLYLIAYGVLFNKLTESFDNLTGSLKMA